VRGSVIAGSGRTGGQQANQPLRAVHTPGRHAGHGLTRPSGARHASQPRHDSSGWGQAPLDLQRARDHGIPDYNRCRECYGLTPHATFADITTNVTLQQELADVFGSVDDVDPLIGGLAEPHVPGSTFGELLSTVVREQFIRMRAGDRLWYEADTAFTGAEIDEVRNTRLSDVIKRNTDINNIQGDVFHLPIASEDKG
jgi:peroxidase